MTQEEFYRDSYLYFVSQLRMVMGELDIKLKDSNLSYYDAFSYLHGFISIFQGVHCRIEETFKLYSALSSECAEKKKLENELCHLLEQMRQFSEANEQSSDVRRYPGV